MKPLIYVAGPYSNPDPIANTHKAARVGMQIFETGVAAVIVPHLTMIAHMVSPRPIEYWYQFDIDQLAHCHAMYRLQGASKGADDEERCANELKMPIFYETANGWRALVKWCEVWTGVRKQESPRKRVTP